MLVEVAVDNEATAELTVLKPAEVNVQEFENRLELVEAQIFEQKTKPRKNIRQLYKLKQDVMELRHAASSIRWKWR